MLIKALCDYADKREKGSNEMQIPDGWCRQDCSYRIMLTSDGKIDDIIDIRISGKYYDKKGKEKTKLVPRSVLLPERTQKTAIDSNTIEHRPLYIFGLESDKDGLTVSDKAKKSHAAFVKHELEFFENLDSEMCIAYRSFIEKWNPENEKENPLLLSLGKDYQKMYYCFGLTGGKAYLEDDEQFVEKYNSSLGKADEPVDIDDLPVCGILGERGETARIHDKIKFPGGLSSGSVLVGMKESAYESYGKTQSYNSNISEAAMKKYTSTLNMLLSDRSHSVIIDDLVIVFFAMKQNDSNECGWFSSFFSETKTAGQTENDVGGVAKKAVSGMTGNTDFEVDPDVVFCIAGMTPNSSRICQKFIYRNKFGRIIENLKQHQLDMRIDEKSEKEIKFEWIKKQLISPKSTNDKVSPPLMTSVIMAAMTGNNYPVGLLETVVRRVKTDSDEEKNHFIKLNDTRAGIIKACINRKLRKAGKEEEIKMALDLENKDQAYLCGRLFAVYEKIQKEAYKASDKDTNKASNKETDKDKKSGLNRTIKDAYFASACARPATVMPKLAMLSQNHMRKLEDGSENFYKKLLNEIMNGFEGEFPKTLPLDDQGKFIIGYYQQNKVLYTSNKKIETAAE